MKKRIPKQRPTTAAQLVRLNARVFYLEAIERREAEYRKALAIVRRREAQLKVARTALDKAAVAFLDPYAPSELTFTHGNGEASWRPLGSPKNATRGVIRRLR